MASFIQGLDRAKRDTENISDRLVQTTRAAASSDENMLAAAEQIVRALANLPVVKNGTADCNRALTDALKGLVFFTNIARIDRSGKIICASRSDTIGLNISRRAEWQRTKEGNDFVVSEGISNPNNNRSVIVGNLPLHNATGFDGALSIAIDVRWLDYMLHARQLPEGAVVAIFNKGGNIIATDERDIAAPIFARANEIRKAGRDLYTAVDREGRTWLYSTTALLGNSVYVGFAMRESTLFGATYIHVGADFILPFLMVALSWLAIWIVTEQQVTRWIIYLRRVAAAYRSGHYALRPALNDAPTEFRLLGNAMSDMASSIRDRDRRLHDALNQKSMLVREVHHRVKNNLQIVMSLLNLQANRLQDQAAQDALRQAQARVNALALVHRILHDIEDLTTVDLRQLIVDLSEQTHEGFAGDRPDLHMTFDLVPREISGNLAVPLALFIVEALTNVFKHAYPPSRHGGTIQVRMKPAEDGLLHLTIEDDGEGYDPAQTTSNIGGELIRTFAQQIGGTIHMRSRKGDGTIIELAFADPIADNAGT